jgi:radial spoke head protein 9
LIRVEKEISPEDVEAEQVKEPVPKVEKDPLASTEEEDSNAGFLPRNFIELDRLQFTVLAIENDCHIMPKGSVKLTELHEVRRNNAFRGLNLENAFLIGSYSHFRNIQNPQKQKDLMKDDAVFHSSFLDEASACKTTGAWSVQQGGTKKDIAVIRNHEWCGYTMFHKLNTKVHGACYIGEGVKNTDLNFLL